MFRGFDVWILVVSILVVCFLIYVYGFSARDVTDGKVFIDEHEFNVDIADTALTRQRGLSGREHLADGEGMLFIFERPGLRRFWMKDMLISIDIIWISDGKVVGFEKNVEPEPGVSTLNLKAYSSPQPVELVLEVAAGTVERLNIKEGDSVSIRL